MCIYRQEYLYQIITSRLIIKTKTGYKLLPVIGDYIIKNNITTQIINIDKNKKFFKIKDNTYYFIKNGWYDNDGNRAKFLKLYDINKFSFNLK